MKIYSFGFGEPPEETSKEVLGGKGAGLVHLEAMGINIPPGLIIPTTVCGEYHANPEATMKLIATSIGPGLAKLSGKFGFLPLLSVRSGAAVSMPGMMDTVLNVGLDESNAKEWVGRVGAPCVNDSRRRLITMFGSVVKGIPKGEFSGLTSTEARAHYMASTGEASFPGAKTQLLASIEAVFKSWNSDRAKVFRKEYNIPETGGTAVTVQAMVFGNMNAESGSGVFFTRDANTGENIPTGDWLINAQGEDVVAGGRDTLKMPELAKWNPKASAALLEIGAKLEADKKDALDIEWTVQNGELYFLQWRPAMRTSRAKVRIAVEMLASGMLTTPQEVFGRVTYRDYLMAQADEIDPTFEEKPFATGTPACSGIATGKIVLSSEAAVASKVPCILVTHETTPDDLAGMLASKGILTMTGGSTCHAAVVARGQNKPAIVGLGLELEKFEEGTVISLDGATGRVWLMEIPVVSGAHNPFISKLEKMLVANGGVGLVAERDADVLDVSGLDKEEAASSVLGSLKTRATVIVDTRPESSNAAKVFEEMFGGPSMTEAIKITHLSMRLSLAGKLKNVWFVATPGIQVGDDVQLIATVKTLQDLVEAKGSHYLMELTLAPWIDKLVEWKKIQDGACSIQIGQRGPGMCYLSLSQIAESLLK